MGFGDDGVGQFRVSVSPQGMGQEPVGIDPTRPPPDEPPRVARHELGVGSWHRGQREGQPEVFRVAHPIINQTLHDVPGQVVENQRHQRTDSDHLHRLFRHPAQVKKSPRLFVPALG